MKKLAKDVSTFSIMISDDYIYVDKTEYIYSIISRGRFYFLSRPRRFGKSLLISTLKELFLGNKKLFKDLWITKNTNYDWQEYPVINLDFSQIPHHTAQQLYETLNNRLLEIAQEQNLTLESKKYPEETVRSLIKELSKKNKVVILIDEYDKPILDHIKDLEEATAQREILRSFYTVIKSMDAYIKFVFLTGVTKIAHTSIFSGLNNLDDITTKPQAAALLGYTQEEIQKNFNEHINQFAQKKQTTADDIIDQMRFWYNGYCFSAGLIKVYNPFSVTYCLEDNTFTNYWIKSGTPKFLIDLISKKPDELQEFDNIQLTPNNLDALDIEDFELITVLFQAGYYTIRDYNPTINRYLIGYPNHEVQEAFTEYLLTTFTRTKPLIAQKLILQCRTALLNNDLESFCENLRILFAHIPYNLHIPQERYYHSLFQLFGTMLGMDIQSEVATDKGRIDLIISSPTYIHIFEIKFNAEPGLAMKQIEDRRYYEKYKNTNKRIILVEMLFTRSQSDFTIHYKSKEL